MSVGLRIFGAVAMLWTGTVRANPVGEQVVGGTATFERVGNSLTINQGSDRAAINWNSFSIGAGEVTKFVQPSASSIALNRVIMANPSSIYGSLQSNGQIILANPSGIFVGPGGSVSTGGFFGSTRDMDPEMFMKGGDLRFLGDSAAPILNQGKIEATTGDVFLIAEQVKNEGQIMARDGTVGLVSGTQVSLQSTGPNHFKVRLLDVPEDSKAKKDKNGTADIVNDGVIDAANAMLEATGNLGSLAINNTGLIRATGFQENDDGSVTLTGGEGDVLNQGLITALQKNIQGGEQGGSIAIRGKNVTAEKGSLISASGKDGGGKVKIESKDTTMLAGRVESTGYGDQAKGGRIDALGAKVGLRSGQINADGGAKGGTVLVGGDYQGLNPEVANAKSVVMLPEAEISARATVNGDGGKAVLWSDDYTGFFGSINTMGGVEGGNGGFVETSSKNNLQSFGQVQASAPKGRAGEWLLDPYNVTISSQGPSTGGGFNGQNPDIFTPTANNANIFNGDINHALDAGTSVTVTTGPSKTVPPGVEPAGNITVAANITKSKDTPPDAPDVVFRLQAANDIIVNGGITISSTAGNLGIELLADYDNTGVGRVDLRDNVTLASNSGNIVLQSATGLSVGTDVSIDATLSLATANAIWGGQRFSGDVTIQPSATAVPTTVGVGGGTGSLQITQAIVDAITLLDPTSVTTARAGTLYLGSTSSGQMTLGTIDGPNGLAVNLQLSAGRTLQTGVLQGIVQDSSGLGAGAGAGMVILKSTGTIGTSGTAVKVRTGQLGVLTEGSLINVSSDQSLTRLYVETAGATPNQIITDGGNLNYDVVEQSLTATIGGVSGFYVNSGSIDFTYINTGGGITVGAAGRMATPTGWLSGIPFGILATQDPNANGGQGVAATPGKVTLKANGALTMTAATAPSPVVSSGILNAIVAASGGIFTGGGDLNIEASDFVSPNGFAYYQFFYTAGDPPPPSGYLGQLLGPQSGPALNTFVPVQSGAGGAGVWDFGLRQLLAFYGDPANGQISGQGGVLSLTSTANIYGPGGITISDGSLSNVFSISTPETFGMEANVIQIGSATSGNLDLLTHDLVFGIVNTVWGRNGGVDFTDTYTPRYFENPYNGYGLDGRDVNTVPRTNLYRPVPHVANGLVHLISGTGAIQLAEGGDVNVTTLGGTSINGVDFLGNNFGAVNTDYAGSNTINNTIYSVGSLIYNLTGRVGRTILDTQITQAASFNAYFDVTGLGTAPTGFFVGDSTDAVRGVAIMGSDVSGTLSVNSIQLDQPSYFVNPNPYRGGQTAVGLGAFTGTAQVLIGPPDLPTGTPAVGSATVVSGRVTGINVDTPGSGYLKPPAVVVVMPKTSGGDTGVGGQQATGIASLSGGQVTGVTPVTANSSSILGGGRYSSTPEVTLVGGGIALGGARAVLNDFGQLGAVAAVQSGLGYTTAPTVSISGGGGTGAIVDAVINNRGELTPYNITFGGSGYKTTPTVVITDPTGSGAVARPIMGGQPGNLTLLGIMPVTGGSGYSNPTIEIIGGDPTQSATATALTGLSSLNSFNIRNPGAGYISEPTVTLSGGGIELAQARPYVDLNPLSGNYGRVTAYELANPGSGYKNAPSVVVGVGGANGQSGEVGVSTDPVDSRLLSGSIVVVNSLAGAGLLPLKADSQARGIYLNAPVVTGNAEGSSGNPALTGSILVEASGAVLANTRQNNFSYGFRGILQTGDASTTVGTGNLASSVTSSGDIRLLASRFSSATSSLLAEQNVSQGLPVQVGQAELRGGLQAQTFGNIRIGGEEGALRIYAPAPGEMETMVGQPLNPNLPPAVRPRVSNDLKVYGLETDPDTVNRVRVEVGAVEGLLSLESFEVSGGTTTVTDGSVTAITAANDGRVYLSQPTVIIGGGGLVPATASAEVMGGALTAVLIGDEGSGYSNSPTVNITGGGGTGAVVQANVVNGKVVSYTILNPGYGYTSAPTLTVTGPTGTQAAASLGGLTSTGGIASLISTTIGSGYGVSPTVKITDPTGVGASVRAVVNSKGQITPYTVVSGGSGYTGVPAVTITGGGGTGATAQAVVQNGVVVGIIPVNGGSGYTSDVTVTIASPTGGGATAVALNATPSGGSLLSFIVNNSGIGYTNPTITVALPQIQATANANLQNQQIESFTITNAGGGYASAPKVYIQAAGSDPFNLDKDHVGFFSDRFGIFKDGNGTELVTAGIVGLGPFTNQRPVNLGTETSGATSFLAADLQRFVADTLVLGTRRYLDPAYGAGVITVSQAISANTINLGALVLAGTREVQDLGGTTGIDFSNLVIDAGGEVSFTGFQNRADYLAGVIRDTGLALGASFRFDAALAGNTADGFKPLTISQVAVGAPEFTGRDFYQGIQTEDGNITLHADDIELSRLVGFLDTTAGVTNGTSTATVTLAPLAPGGSRPVNINYDSLSRPNGTPADSGFYGLTSIQVQTPGSKYKSVPTVTISPSTTGATASGTAQMVLGDIDTAAGIGAGYTSIPTVTITGGGAQRQATGVAVVDFDPKHPATFGKVIAVQITDQGLGYQWTDGTTVPTGQTPLTITFSGGGGVTSTTTGSLVVRSVQLSGGASYTSAPTVTLAQPTGTGGTAATAVGLLGALSLRIGNPNQPELENIRAASVVIGANSGGDSYVSSASSVSLNSDFGYNYGLYPKAPRTAVFAADGVIALGLSQIPPSPYPQPATSSIQVPNFSVIAGGAVNLGQYGQATANAFISTSGGGVSSINVDYAGQGYTQAPTVTLTSADGNGSGATASATINSAGQISQIVLVNAGTGYTTAPVVSLSGPILTATATPVMGVGNVAIFDGGTGYTIAPTVTFADPTTSGGITATGTATIQNGRVVSVSITNPGSGYTSQPAMTFTGGNGTAVTASSYLSIQDYQITNSGTGYVANPIITFTGGGGFGASASASFNSQGQVTGINELNGGSFYTGVPTLTMTGTPSAPANSIDYISALMTGTGNSFRYSRSTGTLTVADLGPLGGATGITTATGGGVFLTAPVLDIPMMPPQLVQPKNTDPYIRNANGQMVVNPDWNPYFIVPPTINSGGSVYLTSSQATTGRISIAVVPTFDSNAWNNPQPTGSTVNPVISALAANSSVVMTADRIEIADNNQNDEPGLLYPALVAANTSSGRVVLQAKSSNTDIVLGSLKGPDFNFTGTELGNIQANVLQVGNGTAGDISVETLIQLDTNRLPGALSLVGNGTIADLGIASLTGIQYGGGLSLSSNGAISFESLLNQFGTVSANSQGSVATPHDITLTSTGFFIGTADQLSGITATGSRVTLQPSSSVPINLGTKTLTTPGILYGGSGYTTAPTAAFSTSGGTGAAASTTVGPVPVTAVTAVTLNSAGSGYTSNPLITLSGGGGSNASIYATSDFSFTDSMLNLVTANTLQIGRNDGALASGAITISAAISPASISTLSLLTGAGVADNGGSTGIQVGSLAIRAGVGNVVLNGAGNNVSNLASEVVNGSFAFTDNPSSSIPLPLNITAVDGLLGIDTAAGNGAVTLTADDMNILDPIIAGSGVITLQPLTPSTNISLNDPSNSLSLTAAELQLLSTSTTVVIGNALGTGTINLGGSGSIDLSGESYSLTLRGAASPLIFNGGLTLADNQTLTLNLGTGAVTSPFTGTDVTIGGAGTLSILSAGAVGAVGAPLITALGSPLPLPGVAGVLSGAVITPGGLYLSNSDALSITGTLNVAGDIDITTQSGALTVSQSVSSANLSLTSATSLSLAQAVNAGGNVTLTASGGLLTLDSTVDATGNITGTAIGNITIQNAVTSGGIVTFSSNLAGTSITLGAGGSITSSLANTPSGTPIIQLTADTLVLGGTLAAVNNSGGIFLQPFSDLPIEVFGVAATLPGAFFIGDADFAKMSSTAGSSTSPITIGKANGTAQVLVHGSATAYPTGINRNLTIQSGAQPYSAAVDTFIVGGALTTTGTNLTLDAGGGRFLDSAAINVGTGTLTVFGQSLEFNGAVNGGTVSLRNKGIGNSYLAYAGPPAPGPLDQIVFGSGSITTNIFGYGADVGTLFIGTLNVGNVIFPGGFTVNSQGLNLYGGTAVQMEGNITSAGLPVTINGPGPLLLTGNRTITMGGGDLSILAGIDSSAGNQTLGISLGAGDLVLAGGDSADVIEGLTITRAAGSTITMGNASAPSSGLSLTVNGAATGMNIPGEVILVGTGTVALTGTGGANLNLGSFVQGAGQTTPLTLTTTGTGNISTTGGIQAGSLTISSSTSAILRGAVVTTGATSLAATTTLNTEAITASTLNVSAGTSATLNGAVSTSAAGGINVSTPSLTTGSTMSAPLGDISLSVNSMNLAGTATAQTGNVVLQPFTAGADLNLGTQVTASSMLQLQAPNGSVTFQTSGAGRIMLAGPINLSSSGTTNYNLVTAGGNVVFSGSSPVLTLPTSGLLSLDLGNGNVISSGGTDYAANQGQLVILSAGNVTIGTDIPTFGRPGIVTAPASLTLRNAGSLSLIGPIDTGSGNVSIQTLSGNLTLASTIAGGTIQLGAARNFNNQAGATPFTNRNGGRTLVYSYGQGYDNPYNFAGLQGFGVAFGRGFGSMIGSGNMLVYSAYAQVALDYGVVYGEMFAGNSVSSLLALSPDLFWSVNGQMIPKAQTGGYIDYMLYPQRVEPATSTLPNPVLTRLEQTLGRPPTISEIVAEEAARRQGRLIRSGALLERNSFDEPVEEEVQSISKERVNREDGLVPDGGVPQAQAPSVQKIPTAGNQTEKIGTPQASKLPVQNQGGVAPMLRRAPNRAVATLRSEEPDIKQILEEEREKATVGTSLPVANQR